MNLKQIIILIIFIYILLAISITSIVVFRIHNKEVEKNKKELNFYAESQVNVIETIYKTTKDINLAIKIFSEAVESKKETVSDLEIELIDFRQDKVIQILSFSNNKNLDKSSLLINQQALILQYRNINKGVGQFKSSNQTVLFAFHTIENLNIKIFISQQQSENKSTFWEFTITIVILILLVIGIGFLLFFYLVKPSLETLKTNDDNFNQLADQINEVFLLRDGTKYIYVSQSIYTQFGINPTDLYKDENLWLNLIHPEDIELLKESAQIEFTPTHQCTVTEFRLIGAGNNVRWLESRTYPVKDKPNRRATIVTDVSKRKLLISQIEINETKYRTIFNTCPDAIMLSSLKGTFTDVNDVFCNLSGYTRAELLNKNFGVKNLWLSEIEREKAFNILIQKGFIEHHELKLITKDGTILICLVSENILHINDKVLILSIIHDVTDQKNLIIELEKSKLKAEESDQLKSAFLNNISHEFRTPINSIIGFTELITYTNQSKEKQLIYSKNITDGCNKLVEVVNLTVEMSQVQSMQVRYYESFFNLNNLLNRIEEEFTIIAETKGLSFEIQSSIKSFNYSIFSDFNKLYKIIKYIVDNAIKFTKVGGIHVNSLLENGHLLVSVQDTGIGIKDEMKTKVFDSFRQIETGLSRNYGGNGLGLSIAKAYVEVMNGRIWLESEFGIGTTVYFTIPIVISKKRDDDSTQTTHNPNWLGKTILVAEDDTLSYDLIVEHLKASNIKILHAKDGSEALKYVETEKIDLILMDIKMPNLDGLMATKEIRKNEEKMPIIAITSYTKESNTGQAIFENLTEMLTKPINAKYLIHILKKYLD